MICRSTPIGFSLAALAGASSLSSAGVVMHPSLGGEPFFRAPQMAVANDGSLLVFAENRETVDDPAFGPGLISLVMSRSTDQGASWSPLQVLASGAGYDYTCPAPIVDLTTGSITLTFARTPDIVPLHTFPTGYGPAGTNNFVIQSGDHGVSWNARIDITPDVKDATAEIFVPSPATGIQLRWQADTGRNGRLVVPMLRTEGGQARALAMYNDHHGDATEWQTGSRALAGGVDVTEADIVELVNGDLMMDARPNNPSLPRQRYLSSDGGETWSEAFGSDLPDVSVDNGLTRLTALRDGDDRNRLVYSTPLYNPQNPMSRANLTVYTSYDEGRTFINPVQVAAEQDGYSNLQRLPDGRLGVVYETTEPNQASPHWYEIDRVMFTSLGVADLEGQTHQKSLTHYEGFGNTIDRLRGGMGWTDKWYGDPTVVTTGLSFSGFRHATEAGRVDLVDGAAMERVLATKADLNTNAATYLSFLLRNSDPDAGPTNNNFVLQLRDAASQSLASVGVSSAFQFIVGDLGNSSQGTEPFTVDRDVTYFLVAKIVSMDDSAGGNYDQIFLKVFESGVDAIPDRDALMSWTVAGLTGENLSGVIDRIAMIGGLETTWSIDEMRVGTTFEAVVSNVVPVPEPGSLVALTGLMGCVALRRRCRTTGNR